MTPLKYHFTAVFADGSSICQQPDDRSAIDPEKRSQFYDVMQHAEVSPLVFFQLTTADYEADEFHFYSVDLLDGHFEVDGIPFVMHEEEIAEPLRLIFFRHHTHGFNQNHEELAHQVSYHFGWQTTVNGENLQRVMQIA